MGIHGVRRPWSSFVSLCECLSFYGVAPAHSRRPRAGRASGASATRAYAELYTWRMMDGEGGVTGHTSHLYFYSFLIFSFFKTLFLNFQFSK